MPAVAERLRHISLKVERAKKHIDDLQREVRSFLDSKPYQVGTKRDPQTSELIYYLTHVESTPDILSLIAGDVVHNLACALDHLAYQIVCSDTNDAPPNPNWIYFPIADDAAKYEARKRGKVEGARQESIDAIDALKPYKGGNDLLWALYRLNNIDKHRLMLTVGSHSAGIHLGDTSLGMAGGEFDDLLMAMDVYLVPADKGFPLKKGSELFGAGVDAEPNKDQRFLFEVALAEPGIVESSSIVQALHQLVTLVEGIVIALTPRLRDTT
jgi:hypothetical protein